MADRFPDVTVILPVRNEAQVVREALEAVLIQDYPGSIDIIIADGMSKDHTRDVIRECQRQHPNIRLIDNPGKIVSTGMNNALSLARGEIIIRVDGHCVIAPNYVSCCVKHLQQEAVDGVGGPMETIGDSSRARTIALAMSTKFGVGDSAFRTEKGCTKLVDTVPFPAYTRAIIEKVGLYDEEFVRNQDDEYNYRIRQLGGKILLAADVHSKYYSRGSLHKLWKQYYQYGYYKVRVFQKHPGQMSVRQFVPALYVLALISSCIWAFFAPFGILLLALGLGSYLVANLVASIFASARAGWRHMARLPVVYAILHFSYGCGFWVGLFHFWNRWGDRVGNVPTGILNH